MKIISAKFLTSSPKICDDFGLSEVAFLGRSNVGKSSLINALTNHQNLAKSSQTPGKTRLINFFEVIFLREILGENGEKIRVIFVDLPGFGYAKVAKSLQNEWKKNLDEFLKNRQNIRLFVHLIDSRHPGLEIDENLSGYLREFVRRDQKILEIYTKSDKINQSQKAKILAKNKGAILVSAAKKTGLDAARVAIFTGIFGGEIFGENLGQKFLSENLEKSKNLNPKLSNEQNSPKNSNGGENLNAKISNDKEISNNEKVSDTQISNDKEFSNTKISNSGEFSREN